MVGHWTWTDAIERTDRTRLDNGKTEGDRGEGGGAEVGRTILEETTKRACLCSVFCLYYKNDSLIKQIK
jgi:hypothetical protein